MLLENSFLLLEIADNTGVILRLCEKESGTEFIVSKPDAAFRVTQKQGESFLLLTERDFSARRMSENSAQLRWILSDGSRLCAAVALEDGHVCFTSELQAADSEVLLVEYPILGGLGAWDKRMEMAHSFATGILVHDPLSAFAEGEGVRFAPYPESFSGASMQFFAYYGVQKGGLLFMARDADAHMKWLNLYRHADGMEASQMYANESLEKGSSFGAQWQFRVSLLHEGTWFAAARRYKEWAIHQPWCEMGTLDEREHCRWLLEDIGWTTFGIDASQDRSEYIRLYNRDIGVPGFHILGPDWTEQDFMGHCPANLKDWTTLRFNSETLRAIREVKDRFAPFEFDFLVHPTDEETQKQCEKARHRFLPEGHTYSCDAYRFNMLCPCEPYTRKLHVERDEIVTDASQADAMYYDISANNLLHYCLATNHSHPAGGGQAVTRGYQTLYDETKKACAKKRGTAFFPVGTEMMNEVFLPQIDFYQARAGAQPASSLEMWPYKKLINEGRAELIPLFAAVYHEFGAVRMDGWGKLVEEIGDLFFDTVAKIYLWGGLYELNHEYSPMEALDGKETDGAEHYWHFGAFGYEYSRGRARYVRQFAALRIGPGNPYLAYGVMMKPPALDCGGEEKHYWHYNHGQGDDEKFGGVISVPAVRASAWQSGKKDHPGAAVFLVNTGLRRQRVTLRLNAEEYGSGTVRQLSDFDPETRPEYKTLGILEHGSFDLDLTLPCRKPVMIEIA